MKASIYFLLALVGSLLMEEQIYIVKLPLNLIALDFRYFNHFAMNYDNLQKKFSDN